MLADYLTELPMMTDGLGLGARILGNLLNFLFFYFFFGRPNLFLSLFLSWIVSLCFVTWLP